MMKNIVQNKSYLGYCSFILGLLFIAGCSENKKQTVEPTTGPSGTFSKVDANGNYLAITDKNYEETGSPGAGTKWSCVRNNSTNDLWEVKQAATDSLRKNDLRYSWYDSNLTANQGSSFAGGADCVVTADCDTEKYVALVNQMNLCGIDTWRIPTADELRSITSLGSYPSVDTHLFPNTASGAYWSSETNDNDPDKAKVVLFSQGGLLTSTNKASLRFLRLIGKKD